MGKKAPPLISQAERDDALAELGVKIAEKRDEAIAARTSSGIEETWKALEDAYLGVDDYNRHEYANAKWSKPTSMTGPVSTSRVDQDDSRSTAFVRLTARYVDAGAARLAEMILPIDEKAFAFKALPNPDLIKHKDDIEQMLHPNGEPMYRKARPEELPPEAAAPVAPPPQPAQAGDLSTLGAPAPGAAPVGAPPAPPVKPMTKADWYAIQMQKSQGSADLAEQRVQRWLLTSKYQAEARKVIHDAARIGCGVLKGPFPDVRRKVAITKVEKAIAIQVNKETVPAVRWIDIWNFWPAPGCGENVHDGDYTIEGDFMTPRAVADLADVIGAAGKPVYIKRAIAKVLREGPNKCLAEGQNPSKREESTKDKRFQVFHFTGFIKRHLAELANVLGLAMFQDADEVPVIITLINDTIVKIALNPLDSGAFPYCVFSWSRRAGHWAGIGVGEQVATPQRICNGGTRAMLNNAGKSAGSQLIVDRDAITPADGSWTVTPDKVWYMTGEGQDPDVRKAMMFVEVPNVGPQMMGVIEYSFKLAEELSNIPLHAQGHESGRAPETFGAAEMLNSNAKTLLRSIAYRWDDSTTEPLVHNMYEWLLLDDKVPEEEKGDFEIDAQGSISMVERAIQEQTLPVIAQMAQDPGYGINKRRFFAELMRAKRMNPAKVQNTAEEQIKIDSQPPQPPVQIAVAQERSKAALAVQESKAQTAQQVEQTRRQTALELEQMELGQAQALRDAGIPDPHVAAAEARRYEADVRAETARINQKSNDETQLMYAETEAQMARDNALARVRELQLKERLALLEYANKRDLTLDQIKADLARTQMDNQTKLQLAAAETALHAAEGRNERTHDLAKHASALKVSAVDSTQEREHDARMRTIELGTTESETAAPE